LKVIKSNLRVKLFHKNQVIFKEDQVGDLAYLIKNGKVAIIKEIEKKKKVLSTLGPGDLFGEMGVIGAMPRNANAVAVEYSELVIIDKHTLFENLKSSPPMIQSITRVLIDRLANVNKLKDQNLSHREFMGICSILEMLSKSIDKKKNTEKTSVSYRDLLYNARDILDISESKIDYTLGKLVKIHLIRIIHDKAIRNKFSSIVRIVKPDQFLEIAEGFFNSIKKAANEDLLEQECIDIIDWARMVKSDPDILYKKIGSGEVPDSMLFIHKQGALKFLREIDEDFFNKRKSKRKKVEELEELEDLVYVDNNTLQEAISEIGFYKLGVLAGMAEAEVRKKIFKNVSTKISRMLNEQIESAHEIDELEAVDIIDELFRIVRKIKGAGR
jgi:CRP-like cAMP-binding protein